MELYGNDWNRIAEHVNLVVNPPGIIPFGDSNSRLTSALNKVEPFPKVDGTKCRRRSYRIKAKKSTLLSSNPEASSDSLAFVYTSQFQLDNGGINTDNPSTLNTLSPLNKINTHSSTSGSGISGGDAGSSRSESDKSHSKPEVAAEASIATVADVAASAGDS